MNQDSERVAFSLDLNYFSCPGVSSNLFQFQDGENFRGMEDLDRMEKATFAAGCFWGVEAAFRKVEGIESTSVGYIGGTMDNPTYSDVCTGLTGHAEAVEVVFDPSRVTYTHLLSVFWDIHDPTTLNRQGPDIGTQYRSAIFYHTPDQEDEARTSKESLQKFGRFHREIVTEIVPATTFFKAEDYHQQYLEKRSHF